MVQILSGDGIHAGGRRLASVEYRGRVVVGWMTDGMRDTLAMLIDRFQVSSVIEVGSFLGLSACWFAEHVEEVTCVDVFDKDMLGSVMRSAMRSAPPETMDNMYDLFLANTAAYPNITSHKMPSLQAAAELDVVADLVYIDADHTYEAVKADVEAWTPHARRVVCGDDNIYQWLSVQQLAQEINADVTERIWWKPA